MNKVKNGFLLTVLFLFSFMFFVYITFPYEILKETLSIQISKATGYSIQVDRLGPNLPLGVDIGGLKFASKDQSLGISLEEVSVNLDLLNLFVGEISSTLLIEDRSGSLYLRAGLGIGDIVSGSFVPSSYVVRADKFPVDQFVKFGLKVAGKGGNPMVAPLLEAIGLKGKLNANVEFDLNSSNPAQSTGFATIDLQPAKLILSHPSLGLDDEEFRKAKIKASVASGKVTIDRSSGLISKGLDLKLRGSIDLKNKIETSLLNMNINLVLKSTLQEKFGFIIGIALNSPGRDNQMTVQMKGPVGAPRVSTF